MIAKVGVLGAGTMGVGIAHVFAEHDYEVIIVDHQQSVLDDLNIQLEKSYKTQCLLSKPKSSLSNIQNRIHKTTALSSLNGCAYLIENTTESPETKQELLAQLNSILTPDCIIAINTSCIPITSLSNMISSPERVLGIHFMNPVPIKHFAEIIKTKYTSANTLQKVKEMLASIGKEGNEVNDHPGFVINRVFMVTINEAIKVYEEKISESPAQIDELFVKCLGHRMGPLMTADLIGLDTILYSLNVLYTQFNNDMYKPSNLLLNLTEQGKLGRKTGEGLYQY